MSARSAFACLTVALLAVAVVGPPTVAARADDLGVVWDGPTVDLGSDGSTSATTTTSLDRAFLVVPGDTQGRTLTVRNTGPTDAVLRGSVARVRVVSSTGHAACDLEGAPPRGLCTDLTLAWRTASTTGHATFEELSAVDTTPIVEVALASGATTWLTLVTTFSLGATSGNASQDAPHHAGYDVVLRLDGRPAGSAGSGASASDVLVGADGRAAAVWEGGGPAAPGGAALTVTSIEALHAAAVAVFGIGLGALLAVVARRRRGVQQSAGSSSTRSAG